MSEARQRSRKSVWLASALAVLLVMILAGAALALTAGNVDGVWQDPPNDPTGFRWCYAPDVTNGPAGNPTDCSQLNLGIQNGPNSTLADENQVRYGQNDPDSARSGFGFNGNNNVGSIAADVPFYLGRFTHYNRPIQASTIMSDIELDITLTGLLCDDDSVPTEGSTQTFTYDFNLDETPNNASPCPYGNSTGNGCDDRVTVSQQPDTIFTCPEGERTVQILGFEPGDGCELAFNPPTSAAFVTGEGQQNEACLWARISDPTTPLAITLASFEATGQIDRIVITWETVSELQNAGFNLYRSDNDYDIGERLNAELIPSQAPGSAQGFAYQFDDFDVTPGQTYWYTLEDVEFLGSTALHGPVSASLVTPTAVTLGDLSAESPASPNLAIVLAAAALGLVVFGFLALRQRRSA